MAYEETLLPVVFVGKKKYYGVVHVNVPRFQIQEFKDLFVKGVDVVKRGQSSFFQMVCEQIMMQSMRIENEKELRDIVEEVIEENMRKPRKQHDVKIFELSAVYKPSMKNVCVNNFAERMANGGIVIEPGERFNYVVIRHPDKNAKKHEKMVLSSRYDESVMKLDMKYYF